MYQTVCVLLDKASTVRLVALATDRSLSLKDVLRARIVLLSGERPTVQEIARQAGVSRRGGGWRWQQRYGEEGVEGLLHDKTRPPGKEPLPSRTVAQVLALTCSEPPGEVTD
ncbi:hypothetical protein MBLL_04287 [Methylobacterium bullatum]|uniref:Insertion element IS150 protein InsJ-like helix-turn-helix domain-containing protein n=2 Tax=Methylobacterium bullatum TaxID=570505 RepID=A0A679K929_9HYPH|nr:hypothetical protein MBLL_04287 [Methylobacterium bullatum]